MVEAAYRVGGSDAAYEALAPTGASATRCPACAGRGMVTPGAIPSRRPDPLMVSMTCWLCVRIGRSKEAAEGLPGTGVLSKRRPKKAAAEAPSEDL